MKVALIWSSPNKDGLTNSAAMQFKKGLENYGVEVTEIHLNKKNIEHCKACGTGRGTLECLHQMEQALTHMGMRAYDRIPVVRYNSEYMLPTLEKAGEVYADKLKNGFNMYY